jgi:hypothetical protein
MSRCLVVLFSGNVIAATVAAAQTSCSRHALVADAMTGTAWNLPLPLSVSLPEQSARLQARYSTRPFDFPLYYSVRLGRLDPTGRGVEMELLHHKLYLENPRPPVDRFEVTHGYNMLMVNAVGPARGWAWRLGLGLVIAHPEGVVGGRNISGLRTRLGSGYHIAGVTAQLATGRRYPLGRGRTVFTMGPEAKLTASWARIGLRPGHMDVPNVALHVLGGFGIRHCGAA